MRIFRGGYPVPLYIRDDEVGALARKVQAAAGARTVTDAVRLALENELRRRQDILPLADRLGKALALADAMATGARHADR
jgi:antitoxin VapB